MSVETAFAPFLEPATMRGLLAAHLPGRPDGPVQVRDVQGLHAWRKTWVRAEHARRAYLLVSYSVGIESRGGAGLERLLLQGRADLADPAALAHPDRATDRESDAPAAQGAARQRAGAPRWPLRLRTPLASLELRCFPDDAALPHLPALHARRVVPRVAAQPLWPRVVSYRPGERCTLAFEDAAGREHAFAKTFTDPRVAVAVAARLEAVAGAVQAWPASRLQVPELLALDLPCATVWTGALDGMAWQPSVAPGTGHDRDGLPGRGNEAGAMVHGADDLARALSDLHGAVVPGLATATREQRLRESGRKLAKLAQALPAAAAIAARALARCESLLGARAVADAPLDVPRHGDVHPGQFRFRGERVALFDFDELALGDAEEDLAALAVSMEVAVLETSAPASGGANAASQLLPRIVAAHAAGRGRCRATCEPLLEFHLRLQWIDRAYRSFWRDGARRRGLVELALRRAAEPGFPASRENPAGTATRVAVSAGSPA